MKTIEVAGRRAHYNPDLSGDVIFDIEPLLFPPPACALTIQGTEYSAVEIASILKVLGPRVETVTVRGDLVREMMGSAIKARARAALDNMRPSDLLASVAGQLAHRATEGPR